MNRGLEAQLAEGKADPYDTHPPLRERIAALALLPEGPPQSQDLPAVSLLEDVSTLERELLAQLAGADKAAQLEAIDWGDVGARVYIPLWTRLVRLNASRLKGLTPETLSSVAANLKAFGKTLVDPSNETPDDENAEALADAVAGAALALLLVGRGGELDIALGHAATVNVAGTQVRPFGLLLGLNTGKMPAHDWATRCVELGIVGLDLGDASPT
jgi:hypothetical protein